MTPRLKTPDEELELSYREMATDEVREQAALAWSEGLIGDAYKSADERVVG